MADYCRAVSAVRKTTRVYGSVLFELGMQLHRWNKLSRCGCKLALFLTLFFIFVKFKKMLCALAYDINVR